VAGLIGVKNMKQLLNYVGRFPNEAELQHLLGLVVVDAKDQMDFDAFLAMMSAHNADEKLYSEMKAAFSVVDKVVNALVLFLRYCT